MVASVTSFGRSGVYDWMVQRVSAVVLALYTLFIFGFVFGAGELTYAAWSGLFAKTWVKIFSLMALVSLAAHAWIGLWTISTDYLKGTFVRFLFQSACGLVAFVYFVWGVQILWGM